MNHILYHAITNVGDDLVDEAITTQLRKPIRWYQYTAMAACLALVLSVGSHLLPFDTKMESCDATAPSTAVPETTLETTTTTTAPTPESSLEENSTSEDARVYHTDDAQTMTVSLVAWQDEGFRGTVESGNDLFPEGAELTVIFEDDTQITLADGALFAYTADSPSAGDIAWPEGVLLAVSFHNYEQYQADNGFYNRVYATIVAMD